MSLGGGSPWGLGRIPLIYRSGQGNRIEHEPFLHSFSDRTDLVELKKGSFELAPEDLPGAVLTPFSAHLLHTFTVQVPPLGEENQVM